MTYEIVSVLCGGPGFKMRVPQEPINPDYGKYFEIHNEDNRMTPCEAYQRALESSDRDVIIFVHDDLDVLEDDWVFRILGQFTKGLVVGQSSYSDSNVVAVGLGGATALGNRDLYRRPFNIWNMARRGYASNQTDWQVHGEKLEGKRRVAVLDAFCMAVRADWLRSRGGWPVGRLSHHCLDLWLACEAARDEKEIWQVGVKCTHHGGGTSTKPAYRDAQWLQGGTLESDHIVPHRWLYDEYKDVLPIEVTA